MFAKTAVLVFALLISASNAYWQERWSFNATAQFFGLPVFVGKAVFICGDARVYALDTDRGHGLWNATVETACQYLDVGHGRVYVGSNNAVTAFDAFTGKLAWEHKFVGSGVPARPTFANDRVLFVVENGGNSTPFTALDWATGEVVFHTKWLATSRIWYTAGLLAYVSQPSAKNTTAYIIARNATGDFPEVWGLESSKTFVVSSITGFDKSPMLAMLTPPNEISVAVISPSTGNVYGLVNFSSATNNFDFTTGRDHFFTIESYGAPKYANSTLSGFRLIDSNLDWSINITAGSPNLAPAANMDRSFIVAQASEAILVFDEYSGDLAWNRTFANPQQVIGSGRSGEFVIGNTVESKIYLFEF